MKVFSRFFNSAILVSLATSFWLTNVQTKTHIKSVSVSDIEKLSNLEVSFGGSKASANLGTAFELLAKAGQILWLSLNTYSVSTVDLSRAFARAYGYCPSDVGVLGQEYAQKNSSRYQFRIGNRLVFVKN